MSQPKIPSSPTAPQAPASSANPELGATITAGLAEVTMASPGATPVAAPDGFAERALRKERARPPDNGITGRMGENPFARLKRAGELVPQRFVLKSKGLDIELDPPFAVLGRLAEVEARLGPEYAGIFAKIRDGLMLVTADAQSLRGEALPEDGMHEVANALANHPGDTDTLITMLESQSSTWRPGLDISAYVQWVLRECYMLQSDMLLDYAAKVKHFNEMRRKLREKLLKPATETQTQWTANQSALDGDQTYVSPDPYPYLDIDANGNIIQAKMSEEDIARQTAEIGGIGGSSAMGSAATGMSSSEQQLVKWYDDLRGESRLEASDREALRMLASADANDEYIKDNFEKLIELLPDMNGEDLKEYLVNTLDKLEKGNTDEAEIFDIYEALNPAQFMQMIALGWEEERFGFGGGDAQKFIGMARQNAVELAEALGEDLATFEKNLELPDELKNLYKKLPASLAKKLKKESEEKLERENLEIKGKEASRILGELSAVVTDIRAAQTQPAGLSDSTGQTSDSSGSPECAGQTPDASGSGAQEVGSPKTLSTVEQLNDYIEYLEEKLSSIGEDAQLANVDLQNILQRQTQTLQMMSNISKILHDTAMAIIRKIGS